MKSKYILLTSLISISFYSTITMAGLDNSLVDSAEKPPSKGSRGKKPDPRWAAKPLRLQRTVLPWNQIIPEHRNPPKNLLIISTQ